MESKSLIILILLIGIFGATAWWHLRENRQLAEFLKQKKLDSMTTEWLMRFAWSRTIQLLATAAFGIVIFISYDWEVTETRNAVLLLNDALEKQQATAQAQITPPPTAIVPATALPPSNTISAAPTPHQYTGQALNPLPQPGINPSAPATSATPTYPPAAPVVLTTPTSSQTEDTLIPPSEGSDTQDNNSQTSPTTNTEPEKATTLEQVYNPERAQGEKGDDQASMDDIKKRYEDILVIYIFLKHCGRIEPTDYNVITSALAQEMASVNAPGRMQADIVNAAKGSYQEIYAQSPCDGTVINQLTSQYHQYIDVLKTNFPPQ